MLLHLLMACTGGKDPDTGTPTGSERVVLQDQDLVSFRFAWTVRTHALVRGAAGTLDWSGLTRDARGIALDPRTEVSQVELVRLRDVDLDEALLLLASGTLSQQQVDLEVDCSSPDARCALSEFRFEAGHPIDLEAEFEVGSGPWMAWLIDLDAGEPRAMLALEPSEGGPSEVAWSDEDSALGVQDWSEPGEGLDLAGADELSWKELSQSSQGASLSPLRIDRVVLARVDEGTAVEEAVLDLPSRAAQSFQASVSGGQQIALASLLDSSGAAFDGVSGAGSWWLALSCSTCAAPQPAAVFRVQP